VKRDRVFLASPLRAVRRRARPHTACRRRTERRVPRAMGLRPTSERRRPAETGRRRYGVPRHHRDRVSRRRAGTGPVRRSARGVGFAETSTGSHLVRDDGVNFLGHRPSVPKARCARGSPPRWRRGATSSSPVAERDALSYTCARRNWLVASYGGRTRRRGVREYVEYEHARCRADRGRGESRAGV